MATPSNQHPTVRRHPRKSILTPERRGGHHESTTALTVEHYTPSRIFEAMPGAWFDLDPCSPGAEHTNVPASVHYSLSPLPVVAGDPAGKTTVPGDGLALDWPDDSYVWLNPPYSQPVCGEFVEKLSLHPAGGMALLFARTDTRWWASHCAGRATAMLFIHGRISFDTPRGPGTQGHSPSPSVLVGYGERAMSDLHAAAANGLGWLTEVVR